MSQEKVNKYKEEKANRKELIAKKKKQQARNKVIAIVVAVVLAVGAVGAIGLTIRNEYNAYINSLPSYSSTTYIVSDDAGIMSAEEAE
ncbi:MAG: hypothetical protein IJA58_01295 [Lachnospiraceae bacterium]|nr:hypothetical protein [Lachnospiraceae bacterium]